MKIPFMMFIEPFNLGGSLYFVYSKDEENNCNCLNMQRDKNNEVFFTGCDLAEAYLMEECEELSHLSAHTIEYLKKVFEMQGYNPEFLGEQVDSLDKLEDIKVHEFENMAKIRESIKIKDDGTLDYDAMTEEEKKKFFNDLYQLYKADAAVFDGAADDGEELNDLKIDRWNESLNLNNIDVDKTSDDIRRDYLNEGRTSSIKKIHTWVPGETREKKFNRYTEEVIPVLDHNDTNRYIRSLNLIKSRPLTEKAPEKEDKLEESTANFASNDGDFPIVAWFVGEMYSMKCPNCGYIIYDDPDHNGIRYCDDCGYEASPEEWEKNKEYDNDAVEIFWDDCMDNFERVYSEFNMDDLKYWQVRPKDGYYEGVQVLVEDTEYSEEDDAFWNMDYCWEFLESGDASEFGVSPVEVKKFLGANPDAEDSSVDEFFASEYNTSQFKSFSELCNHIDDVERNKESEKVNEFLNYLCENCGFEKLEVAARFSNGEVAYKKVEEKSETDGKLNEARLREGPGAGYDIEFLGIKVTNVKIDEIRLDDYNCQYVEFEADIVPGEYDWNAEGYDWRVDGNSRFFDQREFYETAEISGGKVTGSCQNGYQAWGDPNAAWTIDEFVKEIEGESYDLGIMYGGGWAHSDITSPFEMEDKYGIDQSDERSGYKNSYISTASIELAEPERLNQIIEDTRYSDLYDEEEEEEEDLEESKKTKIKEFFGGEWAEPEDDENLDTDDYDDLEDGPWYEHAYQWYESKKPNKSRILESAYRAPKEQMNKAIEDAKGVEIIAAWDPEAWYTGDPASHSFYYQVLGKDGDDVLVHRLKDLYIYKSDPSSYHGTDYITLPLVNEFVGDIQPLSSLKNIEKFDPEDEGTYIHWNEYFD